MPVGALLPAARDDRQRRRPVRAAVLLRNLTGPAVRSPTWRTSTTAPATSRTAGNQLAHFGQAGVRIETISIFTEGRQKVLPQLLPPGLPPTNTSDLEFHQEHDGADFGLAVNAGKGACSA